MTFVKRETGSRPRALAAAAMALAAGAGVDFAAAPGRALAQGAERMLLDRDLRARPIRLLSLTADAITYEDEQGRRRQATVGGFVALLQAPPRYGASGTGSGAAPSGSGSAGPSVDGARRPPSAPPGVLVTTRGERFPGSHAPTGGDEDAVIWAHPSFGRVTIALDRVAKVVMDAGVLRRARAEEAAEGDGLAPADAAPPDGAGIAPASDTVTLINGDTLTGFLLSLGDPVEIEVDGVTVAIPSERVLSAQLANNPEPMSGLVVWLEDGSVAVVASIDMAGGDQVSLRLHDGQSADFSLDSISAVAFDAGRLRPLSALRPVDQRPIDRRVLLEPLRVRTPRAPGSPGSPGSPARGNTAPGTSGVPAAGNAAAPGRPGPGIPDPLEAMAPPADLNAPDVEFPGPMSVRWTLPLGARRFAAVADLPVDALPWGDCELVVTVDGREELRRRLWQDAPRYEFSVALGGADHAREMTIAIEPGPSGPINDRVILRRPLILVDPVEAR